MLHFSHTQVREVEDRTKSTGVGGVSDTATRWDWLSLGSGNVLGLSYALNGVAGSLCVTWANGSGQTGTCTPGGTFTNNVMQSVLVTRHGGDSIASGAGLHIYVGGTEVSSYTAFTYGTALTSALISTGPMTLAQGRQTGSAAFYLDHFGLWNFRKTDPMDTYLYSKEKMAQRGVTVLP